MSETPAYTPPTFVYNVDICYLSDKIARFADEFQLSASSNVAFMNQFDVARATMYLDVVDGALAYVSSQPQLDLPESSPMKHALDPFPEMLPLENDEVEHLFRLTRNAWIELVGSQSSRMPAGILPFDANRITTIVNKMRQWLTEYVAKLGTIDLPETAPREAMTPPGAGGVRFRR